MKSTPSRPDQHWHHLELSEVLRRLECEPGRGLAAAEVVRRQGKFGPNSVSAKGGVPAWKRFLLQFHQPLVYLLLGAVVITAVLQEWVDSSAIFGVVMINAIIGFLQESKAEKAIEALSRMVVTAATVRREGRKQRIPSVELVPGDIVLLQSGDLVPADLRLIEVNSLQINESALTGESVSVFKEASALQKDMVLADRRNLAFAGTMVTYGQAVGVVFEIGDDTETGRIAQLLADTVELSTPLTRKIAAFSKLLLWVVVGLAIAGFTAGVLRGERAVDMFMAAVALAVGAIPEGLPAAVTIVLAVGVSRMAKRRAIIRKLPAVETLGSTTVICSDKTGTLTENQMTVQRIFAGGEVFTLSGGGYDPRGEIRQRDAAVDPAQPLLTFPLIMRTGLITSIMIGGAYWMFFHEFRVVGETLAEARTAVVNVIVMVEVAYLFSCRSLHRSVFRIGFWTNPYVIMGAAAMIVAQMFFTYAPAMNHLFHSTPLSLERWGRILGVALSSFLAVELEKWIRFGGSRRGRALPE